MAVYGQNGPSEPKLPDILRGPHWPWPEPNPELEFVILTEGSSKRRYLWSIGTGIIALAIGTFIFIRNQDSKSTGEPWPLGVP
jgi:hypothetical protein